ncbi:AGC protein kinase [Phytophthora cinnamomi]|uniref:AGC protein kinase n=1 Tax=Phytophthora cinnamomi TaxID=4785 RepID=UPI00355A3F9B|nr:AGC protein kinase [Phytophthora cinnamomi]
MDDLEELQLLGRGGYASVYLVRRNNSSDLYALKRIPRSKVVTEQQKLRLEAEKFILEHVTSPFLCRGVENFETTEEVAFLQEYVEGRALYECVWKYKETGRFPEHVAKFFAAQLVLAVRDLHAGGFIHRDLKSGNVLVGKDGFAKVIDFGLAKKLVADGEGAVGADRDFTQRTQSMCGTHYVMAPEVYFREPYGFSIDWSVGVVIYEMVAGRPPWEYKCPAEGTMAEYFQRIKRIANTPHQNSTQVPLSGDLQSFVSGLLKVNPRERLGRNGATEVMQHVWFQDIKWELLDAKDASVVVPYDPIADYNAARIRTPPTRNESLSSAESIDPEDNAKYFADF